MVEVKQLAGVMNLDDPEENIPAVHHASARNMVFRGNGANMRGQKVRGNNLIPNANLPATGIPITIGAHYDQVRGRLFFFNYNSTGKHGIYFYTPSLNTITQLIQNGVNAASDALSFSATRMIIGIGIIYGDSLQGDILYFLDSDGKPSKININRALSGGYGTIQRSYLDVAKEPPDIPPQVAYEDDATVRVNNVRKRLFVPMSRFWFDDNDKSTWSEHGEVAIPLNPFDKAIDQNPTKNADIAVVVQTGKPNVKKIEIAMAVSLGNVFSDFFSVAVLDKAVLNIPDDDTYLFRFYNDKAYNYVETNSVPQLNESILLYDLVPQAAQAQEILNGNTLIYGNITEGYPNITSFTNGSFTTNVASGQKNINRTNAFFLFLATQGGKTVNGTGNIHITVAGNVYQGIVFTVITNTKTITYTTVFGDSVASVIAGLQASAVSNGFTVISSDGNNLYITQTNENLNRFSSDVTASNLNIINSTYPAYNWSSVYDFGIVYYDEKGRTNGVVTEVQMSTQSIRYAEVASISQLPLFTLSIYHRPPIWGKTYSVVRTKNLTKSKFVQWISDRTYKDTSSSSTDVLYAYISIENLNTFVSNNPGSPLTYQFSANDRIRFMKLYNTDLNNPIYGTDEDFEIQGQVINPVINGIQQTGQFIKIVLPTTNTTFDFGVQTHAPFPNPLKYNNYFIELYSPAQSVANGLDLYYEFDERFAVINPGTGTQYHQGQTQNQTSNLVTPAVILMEKGDDYYRIRSINTGIELKYQIASGYGPDSNAGQITLGCALQSSSYNDPNILTGNSPYNNLTGFNIASNNDRWIIRIVTGTYIFRIKGTITITFADDRPGDSYYFALSNNLGTATILVPIFDSSKAGTYSFPVDATFTLTSGQRIFIFGLSVPNVDHTRSFESTTLTITSEQFFTQTMIDPNFSDFYPSAVNSNGRALVINPNAAQTTFPVMMRWGQPYQLDTNINQSNRFYATTFDTIDLGRGSIQKFKARDRIMRIYQERGCGQVGVYTKFIQDSGGQNTLTTTDDIITANNIQYYSGEYGCGLHPEGIVHGKIQDYIQDYINGNLLRLSNDGFVSISELYKGQFTIKNLLTPYNKIWSRPDGTVAKMLGAYDYFEEQFMPCLQGGVNNDVTLNPQSFAFNEPRNAFTTFFDFSPDWISSAEDLVYTWLEGELYVHNNENAYCTFYGSTRSAVIDLVFNGKEVIKKIFNAVAYQSDQIWQSPTNGDVKTSMINPQTFFQQISQLKFVDYEVRDNIKYAAFLRDANSMQNGQLALVEGDYLNGNWIRIRFSHFGTQPGFFYAPYIEYELNPRNL